MRYFKCKARMELKIKPETEKGESAMEQIAEKSVSYIEKNSSGCLGCITSVYKKECTFIFAGNGDDAQIEKEIAVRANSGGRVYDNDIAEIKEWVNRLWQQSRDQQKRKKRNDLK